MGPESNHWCLYKREENSGTQSHRVEDRVTMEAEAGVVRPQEPRNTKNGWQPPEARKKQGGLFLAGFRGSTALPTLISDFWSPEQWENGFLLFSAIKFVAICQGSTRKVIHIAFQLLKSFIRKCTESASPLLLSDFSDGEWTRVFASWFTQRFKWESGLLTLKPFPRKFLQNIVCHREMIMDQTSGVLWNKSYSLAEKRKGSYYKMLCWTERSSIV